MRIGTWRWPLAAALLFASVGSRPTEAWAQTDNPLPPAPPEVQEKTPRATTPDEPPPAAPDTPLSEELERSEGVIVPVDPGVDPDMGHGKDSHQILTHRVGVEDGDGAMRSRLEAVH